MANLIIVIVVLLIVGSVIVTTTTAYEDPFESYINRTDILMSDQWGNLFACELKLTTVNHGTYEGNEWFVSIYDAVIFYDGGGDGVYGDVVAHWEVFDATRLEGTPESGEVMWEFDRSGWGNFTIKIDGSVVAYMPALPGDEWTEPYVIDWNATTSYFEGVYP